MERPSAATADDRVVVRNVLGPRDRHAELAGDVRDGLTGPVKEIPPKYFYDARGSELFERITALPEYYLTRAETEILELHAADFVSERIALAAGILSGQLVDYAAHRGQPRRSPG